MPGGLNVPSEIYYDPITGERNHGVSASLQGVKLASFMKLPCLDKADLERYLGSSGTSEYIRKIPVGIARLKQDSRTSYCGLPEIVLETYSSGN